MDKECVIIENTQEARQNFGYCYGGFMIELTNEQINALQQGKCLATTVNCEEYSVFIRKNSADSAL